ncbi:MAG: hypothetical protein V4724_04920 [Pseudomonadota bacterium]
MKTAHQIASLTLLAACAALAAPTLAAASKAQQKSTETGLPRHGLAVYSDLCVHPDSGEFGGQRISVQRFAEVDTVYYEYTAGGLSWPVVASDVNIDPRGRMLVFTVQLHDEEERTISGKFSDGAETLVLDGERCGSHDMPVILKKVRDFSRAAGPCKPCPAAKVAPSPAALPPMPHEAPVRQAAPDPVPSA